MNQDTVALLVEGVAARFFIQCPFFIRHSVAVVPRSLVFANNVR